MSDPAAPPIDVDTDDAIPEWAKGGDHDLSHYTEAEIAVAAALSTMPPFASVYSPCALPFGRRALEALSEWEPSDSFGYPEEGNDE